MGAAHAVDWSGCRGLRLLARRATLSPRLVRFLEAYVAKAKLQRWVRDAVNLHERGSLAHAAPGRAKLIWGEDDGSNQGGAGREWMPFLLDKRRRCVTPCPTKLFMHADATWALPVSAIDQPVTLHVW